MEEEQPRVDELDRPGRSRQLSQAQTASASRKVQFLSCGPEAASTAEVCVVASFGPNSESPLLAQQTGLPSDVSGWLASHLAMPSMGTGPHTDDKTAPLPLVDAEQARERTANVVELEAR